MALHWRDYQYIFHKNGGHDVVFEISDEDITSDPSYFGYMNEDGCWIIQQRTASTGAYRYAYGKTGYAAAWTGRAALTYGYWNEITT